MSSVPTSRHCEGLELPGAEPRPGSELDQRPELGRVAAQDGAAVEQGPELLQGWRGNIGRPLRCRQAEVGERVRIDQPDVARVLVEGSDDLRDIAGHAEGPGAGREALHISERRRAEVLGEALGRLAVELAGRGRLPRPLLKPALREARTGLLSGAGGDPLAMAALGLLGGALGLPRSAWDPDLLGAVLELGYPSSAASECAHATLPPGRGRRGTTFSGRLRPAVSADSTWVIR